MMLEKFETYLQKVSLMQKVLIFLMPMMIMGSLVFMYVIPTQEEQLELLNSEDSKLQAKIKRKSSKTSKKEIAQAKKKLLKLKEKAEEEHDSLNFLYAKLTNMEVLEFDEKQWTATLDAILKKSLTLNIKLQHIRNSDSERKGKKGEVVPKKYIEIIGSATYSDALKYLHFIENRQFLVDVKNIKMKKTSGSNKINFHFNFTIYGVNI